MASELGREITKQWFSIRHVSRNHLGTLVKIPIFSPRVGTSVGAGQGPVGLTSSPRDSDAVVCEL